MSGTRQIPAQRPRSERMARLRGDEWRAMTVRRRRQLIARMVGDLARQAAEQGLRFRAWPTVRVRWLVLADPGGLIDAPPWGIEEATFVELIVSSVWIPDEGDWSGVVDD